ncbi:STR8 [Symbiodinium natans]|uniref:STR8 protein n=1 Tax=Symbiodinium natans TaxID=878477 RepID=A0A812IAH3_9DINO|nr:STR8 [Symbiodinium natans]
MGWWPDSKRFWLYWRVEWARSWLPQNMFHLQNKRILVTTILRDPVERIRSYYYYQNPKGNHSLFLDFLHFRRDYVAGNWTMAGFEEQAKTPKGASTFSILHRSCCEYETWLGQGCVEKAKITLATQFDLVGITERMNEAIVSLGKLYGKTAEEMAAIGQHVDRDKDNSGVKLDWTDEEKSLATYIANKSTQVYNFAQEAAC